MSTSYVEIAREAFQRTVDDKPVDLYTLRNRGGMLARLTNQGGKLVQLLVPDRNNRLGDVVLGYETLEGYLTGRQTYGAVVGRFANRIAGGRFTLSGIPYQLPLNNGPNHIHGGRGVQSRVMDGLQLDDRSVRFSYRFRDGEEGYPGNTELTVTYVLGEDHDLAITYEAVTDAPTVVNFTNHSYFNLAGEGTGDILEHDLLVNADRFIPYDAAQIPTGELRPVQGTPLDFRRPCRIGARIDAPDEQLQRGRGYDHTYVLDSAGQGIGFAARLAEPGSGRILEVYTTEPGLQVYSGNALTGKESDIGKGGKPYAARGAICLETQHFPDAPNRPRFPTTVLGPGERFRSVTVFRFGPRCPRVE
jgi:aldose 1-epimerase